MNVEKRVITLPLLKYTLGQMPSMANFLQRPKKLKKVKVNKKNFVAMLSAQIYCKFFFALTI